MRDYLQERHEQANARLRAALDKPDWPPGEQHTTDYFDPWGDLIDGMVGPYNSEIDRLAVDCLKAIRDRTTFDLLDTDRELPAEMFLHILCVWLCEYGTSPRGCFPATPEIRGMWQELIDKWEAYADAEWHDCGWRQ